MSSAAAVRQAWGELLADAPPGLPWDVAGGDSLATLHLIYRLEQLLGRTLSFEVMQPDMTQVALIAALDAEADADAAVAGPVGVRVFLLPGLYGDEPGLAAFRRGLSGRVAFELVDPPGIETPATVLADLRATAALAARDIDRRQPGGPLIVAGYSFGGSVALEAAAQLMAAGREVALVVILDSAFGDAVLGPRALRWQRRWRRPVEDALDWIIARDRLRSLALALTGRVAARRVVRLRRKMMHRLRTGARMAWLPSPLTAPMLIVISSEFAPVTAAIWAGYYPQADVRRIAATHHGLIRGEGLPGLIDAVGAAVERHARHPVPA
ncbi:alpha/beta fold hydrolase [Sphingosinicellaceae bacterium]|nr:alpha/beta fold hydrolase [Sphingosinicellaceae bacterium]